MAVVEPVAAPEQAGAEPAEGPLRDALALLRANKVAFLGAIMVIVFTVIGIIGAIIVLVPRFQHLYLDQNLEAILQGPSRHHLLGTDNYGRDILWRTIAGIGVSLAVAVTATSATLVIGLTLGLVSGYLGGKLDTVINACIDLAWGFPLLLVAVVYAGALEPGVWPVILAVGTIIWAGFARVIRAQVLTLREREFIEAARALGTPSSKIMLRHLVPNVMGTVLVMASYYIAITVITEAGFSFIGLGVQQPTPSLGRMVAEGRDYFAISIWPAMIPGITIALIVLALNSLGDGLRDIFDPKLRRY
jgi:peptide/nickel transport system permease protein